MVTIQNKTITFEPIEKAFHLDEILRYELDGRNIGAYLLKKGGKYRIIFPFSCSGIPPYISEEKIHDYLDPIEKGITNLAKGEILRIHQGFFAESDTRRNELLLASEQAPTKELRFLQLGEIETLERITDKGLRQESFIYICCSYTPSNYVDQDRDRLDKLVEKAENIWDAYFGGGVKEQETIFKTVNNAYKEGFLQWQNMLQETMGLSITPLSDRETYCYIRQRFRTSEKYETTEEKELNQTPPQVLVCTEKGLHLEENSSLIPVSKILSELPDIPVPHRSYVKTSDKYVGILTLTDKPTGSRNKREKIKFIWNILSKPQNYNNEVIVEISLGDKTDFIEELDKVSTQSIDDQKYAQSKGKRDVRAELRSEDAAQSQKDLYDNVEILNVTGCILVYRDNPQKLEVDCNTIKSQVQKPFSLYRENTYAWKTWLQTFPIRWQRMLRVPYDRYQPYKSSNAGFITPLILPQGAGKRGMEFIAESGIPIYYDTARYRSHTLIVATQGGGKSVLLSHLVLNQRINNIPVSLIDIPKADGYSSHYGLCKFLGDDAAYLDVAKEKINIFELPDLQSIKNPLEKESRRNTFKDRLVEILTTRVMAGERSISKETVRSLLVLAIEKFFDRSEITIRNRIKMALEGGLGSSEWQQMPTIKDFIPFISLEKLNIKDATPDIRQAINFIRLKLDSWIKSRVGRAISEPSTINTKAGLMVYALTGISNEEDAEILLMGIHMEIVRKSMNHKISTIIADEISQSMQYETNINTFADYTLNGGKSGIQVVLAGQTVSAIERSDRAADILGNINNRMIGYIESSELKRLTDTFDYPKDLLRPNTSTSFQINKQNLSSNFTVDTEKQVNRCKFFANKMLLGLTANENDQVEVRERIMRLEKNKLKGCKKAADAIIQGIRN